LDWQVALVPNRLLASRYFPCTGIFVDAVWVVVFTVVYILGR